MNESYKESCEKIYKLGLNNICAAKIEANWYRVKILTILQDVKECTVQLIDFGRQKRVKFQNIRMLKPEFINMTPLVMLCRLVVLDEQLLAQRKQSSEKGEKTDFETNVINRFNALLTHRPTAQILLQSVVHDRCSVYLYLRGIKRNLLRSPYALSECYSAFAFEMLMQEENGDRIECPSGENELIPPTKHTDQKMAVFIKHIESPAEIYVILRRNMHHFREMQYRIQNYVGMQLNGYNQARELVLWPEGAHCLVYTRDPNDMFSLYNWHRGQIVQVNGEVYHVRLRDIGVVIETTGVNILPTHIVFASTPDYVVRCHLSGLKSWLTSTGDQLADANKLSGFQVAMKIEAKYCGSYAVTFYKRRLNIDVNFDRDTEWIDLNILMIINTINDITEHFIEKSKKQRKLLKSLMRKSMTELVEYMKINENDPAIPPDFELDMEDEDVRDDDSVAAPVDISDFLLTEPVIYEFTAEINEVERWLPSQPIEKTCFSAVPTHVRNNLVIYMHDLYREYVANRIRCILNYQLAFVGDQGVIYTDWNVGQACFAQYYLDRFYYRGKILRVNEEQRKCLVSFYTKLSLYHKK